MKRLILSLFVVLLGATSAMGQGYTADWVVKSSNELLYKVSERGNVIRMELPKKDGGVMPMFLLLMIPIVNLLCLIVWACGGSNKKNKVNLSRAMLF